MIDWEALGPGDTDFSQGGGIIFIIVSLIVIYWMWEGIRED
jgi:hypothetical protein